ncbi:Immunity protein 70 [Pseudobutyrivibrio sp. AR14]|nr:Imm70 family immunity protein [Pseudobutyrivibrio sp. AR14]SCY48411.1 Immunity protein 70 [Pseudobutyrivibrio sp. AR14]
MPISNVIWDIDDLNKPVPWGDNISSDITDLSNYFCYERGKGLDYTFS